MTKEAIANGVGDIPSLDVSKLSQYFRNSMVAFFLQRKLLNERLAKNMLDWTHSGFNRPAAVCAANSESPSRSPSACYRHRNGRKFDL
jgi:hypothetical protein